MVCLPTLECKLRAVRDFVSLDSRHRYSINIYWQNEQTTTINLHLENTNPNFYRKQAGSVKGQLGTMANLKSHATT